MSTPDDATTCYDDLCFHECCELIQPMTDQEMDRLTDSIRRDGLQVPILKTGRLIIDGRSRYIAMRNIGITFLTQHFREWDGRLDPFHLVMDLNADRRHMTASQLAVLEVMRGRRLDGEPQRGRNQTAKSSGVSAGYVTAARQLLDASPEAAREVAVGTKTLPAARREVGLDQAKAPRVDAASKSGPTPETRRRRDDSIEGNVLVAIRRPEVATRLQDIEEEYEERRGIREDVPDQQWAEELPLALILEGKLRDAFLRDALAYRAAESAMRLYCATIGDLLRSNRRAGPWLSAQDRALSCNHPEDWEVCRPRPEGGCDGAGSVGFVGERAECKKCRGSGYTVR